MFKMPSWTGDLQEEVYMSPPPGCVRGRRTRFADFESYLWAQAVSQGLVGNWGPSRTPLFNNDMENKSRKKREKKKELLRALFERYWRRSPNRIPAESDIYRNIEHPTNILFTQQHTLLTHSLININKTRGWSIRLRDYRLKLRLWFLSKDYKLWA